MSRSIESLASLVKKEIFLGSLHGNYITEAMSGQAVSVYSAESLMFIYGMLPQNNELWPSLLWWLQTFMLRRETTSSSCCALQCPPGTDVWTLFSGILSGSYGNDLHVLTSALEQHSWRCYYLCSHVFQTQRAGMRVPLKSVHAFTLCQVSQGSPWTPGYPTEPSTIEDLYPSVESLGAIGSVNERAGCERVSRA